MQTQQVFGGAAVLTAIIFGFAALTISSAFAQTDDYGTGATAGIYCPQLSQTVVRGSSGNQVLELQKFLSDYYDISPATIQTGYFGRITQSYVIKFQQEQGLPSYGIAGSLTRAAILKVCGSVSSNPTFPTYPTSPVNPTYPAPSAQAATIDSNSATTFRTNGTISGTIQGFTELCVSMSSGEAALPVDPVGPGAIPNYERRECNMSSASLLVVSNNVWKLSVPTGAFDNFKTHTVGVYQPTKYSDGRTNWNGGKLLTCAVLSPLFGSTRPCGTPAERPDVNTGNVMGVVVGKGDGYLLVSWYGDRGDPAKKVFVTSSTSVRTQQKSYSGDLPATLAEINGNSGGGTGVYVTGSMNADGSITAEKIVIAGHLVN